MALKRRLATIVALGAVTLAGCSSPASTTTTTTTTSSSSTTSTTTPKTSSAKKLKVTKHVRKQLIKAGAAALNSSLPVSAYSGLAKRQTYYAYDPTTKTYWAGAALVPCSTSKCSSTKQAAAVSVQDDGSYLLFTRTAKGKWKAVTVGLTLGSGAKCPTAVPSAILKVWHWAAGTCRAPV